MIAMVKQLDRQQCLICWEESPGMPRRCSRCQRVTCRRCLQTFLNARVHQGRVDAAFLACPNFECQAPFTLPDLQALLDAEVCAKVAKMREITSVNQDRRRCWCPNAECGAVVRLPRSGAILPRKLARAARCQECQGAFCSRCGELPHRGPCAQDESYETWRNTAGERDDGEGVQECPRCHHHIEKRGGCQHMSCPMCRAEWCWLCRLPWRHHHSAVCYAIRECKDRGFTDSPIRCAATISVGVPVGLCAGAAALTLATVFGAGWMVGAATYAVVVVPGRRAKERLSRRWRERKATIEVSKANQHEDVPEDIQVSPMRNTAPPGITE